MQNPIPTFRQSCIISEKPGYLSEKLKTSAPTTIKFNIFFAEILHTFPTLKSQQKCVQDF